MEEIKKGERENRNQMGKVKERNQRARRGKCKGKDVARLSSRLSLSLIPLNSLYYFQLKCFHLFLSFFLSFFFFF